MAPHVLTPSERLAVREYQEDLQAVKRCITCHLDMPIGLFDYQSETCDPCRSQQRFDRARAMGNQRLEQLAAKQGVGTAWRNR